MRTSLTAAGRLFPLVYAVVLLLGSALPAESQKFRPTTTFESTFAIVEDQAMYVLGGITQAEHITDQAFMLDLSKSWETKSPAYVKLANGVGLSTAASGISSDRKRWYIYTNGIGYVYDLTTGKTTQILRHSIMTRWGMAGATDTKADIMYIPFAYPNAELTWSTLAWDLRTGRTTSDYRNIPLPMTIPQYAAVWNPFLNAVVYYGTSGFQIYTKKDGWKQLKTGGVSIRHDRASCLASLDGGKTMVLFGGESLTPPSVNGDIYLLEYNGSKKTWNWRQGPSVKPSDARRAPACATSNGQVVIWGGSNRVKNGPQADPASDVLVFNVTANAWTNKFVARSKSSKATKAR
ncbi:hypothetical protein B0O80DRAFT_506373 [Mortierella sp. GBAus27b]|nr:hypothetical protein BGX31_000908 [Mortierella sp. GBA43]KAI8356450.1 hypothetical protein B0O80DRAFT_506373 [Mortierella sp. GBAus27b]